MTTIQDIKKANRDAGHHFFDADTMKFFKGRVLSDVYEGAGGIYFVTSERFEYRGAFKPRKYKVRRFNPETGFCATWPGFEDYDTAHVAKRKARLLAV